MLSTGVACRSGDGNTVAKALKKRIAANATVVDFSTLGVKFDWDRMYVF
jgi:hypothetical protein